MCEMDLCFQFMDGTNRYLCVRWTYFSVYGWDLNIFMFEMDFFFRLWMGLFDIYM